MSAANGSIATNRNRVFDRNGGADALRFAPFFVCHRSPGMSLSKWQQNVEGLGAVAGLLNIADLAAAPVRDARFSDLR